MNTARRSVLSARTLALTSAVLLGGALLAGCGESSSSTEASSTPAASSTATAASNAALTLADPWVKAAPSGMTALFGTLKNPTASDIVVISGSSPVASMVEMHEVAMVDGAMKMRPKDGGFVVPAGGSHELKPGHDHVMLMGLKGPVAAGQTVTVTLQTKDGAPVTVTAVAKDFAGGNETYAPSSGGMSMSPSASMSS